MKEWKIPIVWQCWGTMKIEADTLLEAMKKAMDDETPLPTGWYIDDSVEIDHDGNADLIREIWNDGQEDE